ncbi:FxsA family protein [Psychrobacillus sp. OK028]|uniref:FxsA family protein n=1 Tax=Psychrobacillus sp. OK028 TaxID=1884359 RepID=UPI0020C84A3E|nr:FxsA family protein [Psychrobacillus sp. OK028]
MMKWIIGLFILIPAVELYILMLSGKTIGVGYTFLLIIASGIIGGYLAKRQGLKAFREVSESVKNYQAPGEAAINGISIFVGAILVVLPGFISDILGLMLLFAPTRNLFKPLVYRWIRKKMKKGQVIVMKSS